MKIDLTVGGYIFNEDKVLLIHHNKLDIWIPVGGHIDPNETPDDALKREIREETSLNVEIITNNPKISVEGNVKRNLAQPFYVNVHNVGDHDHVGFYYVCKALNPENLEINNELKDFNWFTKEDLNKNIVPKDVKNQALEAFKIFDNEN